MISSYFVKVCGYRSQKTSHYNFVCGSRDSPFGIERGYGWRTGSRYPARPRNFIFPPLRSDLLWGQTLANGYPGALSPGLKPPGSEADNWTSSNVEVKICGAMSPLPVRLQTLVLNYQAHRKLYSDVPRQLGLLQPTAYPVFLSNAAIVPFTHVKTLPCSKWNK
jgi:hypothetical protein